MIGLASSGVHSNGFSLVRKIVENSGLGFDAPAPFSPVLTLGGALLTPTKRQRGKAALLALALHQAASGSCAGRVAAYKVGTSRRQRERPAEFQPRPRGPPQSGDFQQADQFLDLTLGVPCAYETG